MAEEKKKSDFVAHLKGIPKVIKELPKLLLSMWKDPVKTPDQLKERRAQLWSSLLLFVIAGVVLLAMQVIPVVGLVFGLLGAAAALLALFTIVHILSLRKIAARFANLTCDNCNHLLDIDTHEQYKELVFYKVVSHDVDISRSEIADEEGVFYSLTVSATAKAELEVSFKCPACGTIKTYTHKLEPFRAEIMESKVHRRNVKQVMSDMEEAIWKIKVKYVLNHAELPYTINSVHHPDYGKKIDNKCIVRPMVDNVVINYHRDIEEMVEGYFVNNEAIGKTK